jgi:hypothetical protein
MGLKMFAASGTGYGMTISSPRIVNTITSTVTPTVLDDFEVHVFTGSGSISFSLDAIVQFLIVGGGGGGGYYAFGSGACGGGGAGGLLVGEFTALSNSTYTITVGAGGNGGSLSIGQNPSNGSNSSISGSGITTITSYGGGSGGSSVAAGNGGSGGGAVGSGVLVYGGKGVYPGSTIGGTYNITVRQGYDGGNSYAYGSGGGGGGGGGPGISGTDVNNNEVEDAQGIISGNGGPGALSNITGPDVYYAGGGGGIATSGQGGVGGGGNGGSAIAQYYGGDGTSNTGGGGGAGVYTGGQGGSGVVIIRYQYQVSGITISNGVPAAPRDLTITDAFNGGATVSYTAPIHNGGKSITGYTLTISPGITPITNTTDNPILVTGLTNGVSYTFSLVANNAIGSSPAAVVVASPIEFISALATGGTVTTYGSYKIHTFTGTGSFVFTTLDSSVASTITVDYVVVAGGGGAGNRGGGGAGGYLTGTLSGWTKDTSYTVTVGAGGVGYANGVNSSISGTGITTKTAIGGGKGAVNGPGGYSGSGGSGGGGAQSGYSVTGGNVGTTGQGNAGGTANSSGSGGGGGAGGVGGTAYLNTSVSPNVRTAGNGGVGVVNPIVGSATGELYNGGYYLAGGGGGAISSNVDYAKVSGSGGLGGGGAGGVDTTTNGTQGTDNTGGGGGGSFTTGGNGGSGVIILKYRYLT